jgi:hypothetical protein
MYMISPDIAVIPQERKRETRRAFIVRFDQRQFLALNELACGVRRSTGRNCSASDVIRFALDLIARNPNLLEL